MRQRILTLDQMRRILTKLRRHPTIFNIRDFSPVPGFRSGKDTCYQDLCKKYGRKAGKDGWDMRHLACVINYLRCFDGPSRPRVLSSDRRFKKSIKAEGFDVIDPEKITKDEFISMVNT